MAQWLITLIVLGEDLGSAPSTKTVAYNYPHVYTTFCLCRFLSHMVFICMQMKYICLYIFKLLVLNRAQQGPSRRAANIIEYLKYMSSNVNFCKYCAAMSIFRNLGSQKYVFVTRYNFTHAVCVLTEPSYQSILQCL